MIIFNNFFKINFLLIFLIILISFIGFAALYSAADGNFYPWSVRHLVRFFVLRIKKKVTTKNLTKYFIKM